ncbi:MAG TPA: triose-phosphate isomerase [Sandaracinaceae bacterium LLY-WYZ-13_1]|nr:triose-phosphate isomerase [Sandaracinaceae bacterium LLY-WYZ-13_1]
MSERKPLIAGNWKLNKTVGEAVELARAVKHKLPREAKADVMIAPVFTALWSVHEALGDESRVLLGAQDCHWEDAGAYTGEVSPPLLKDVGCEYVIVGHSERRHVFGEQDEHVRRKVGALLSHGLSPILCVGETDEQREADRTEEVVLGQLDAAVEGLTAQSLRRLVVAYEPVWAIGTGKTAEPEDAQAVHAAIRARIADRFGDDTAAGLRILYGGSVKPKNAAALLAQPDLDGALVGGASLEPDSFLAIVAAAD